MHREIVKIISSVQFLLDATNMSDHLPVRVSLSITGVKSPPSCQSGARVRTVREFRWDKGDLSRYYLYTGQMLSKICHRHSCINQHCNESCRLDIDIHSSELIHCLMESARQCIPRVPKSCLTHYWSATLDDLKHNCISSK